MSDRSPADHPGLDASVLTHYRRILLAIQQSADELAEAVLEAVQKEVPAYLGQDASYIAAARHYVAAAARLTSTAGLDGRRLTSEEITTSARGLAIETARAGIPLEAYLKAYRVSQRIFWNHIVAAADGSPAGDKAVLILNAELVRYTHLVSTYGAQAFLEYQHQQAADADRRRRDLVENLLAGVLPNSRALLELARSYGVSYDSPLVTVVCAPLGGEALSADELVRARTALAGTGTGERRVLVAARHEEIVALAVTRTDSEVRRLCTMVCDVQRELAERGVSFAVGVSTVTRGVEALPRGYREAKLALDLVGEAGGVTALPLLSPFRYLTLRADPTAWQLVDPRVRELLEDDRCRGGPLIATVHAFAEADLNLRTAAQHLQVHHNTAQYRLRRIQQRTGRNPRHLADLLELLVAIALLDTISVERALRHSRRQARRRSEGPQPCRARVGRKSAAKTIMALVLRPRCAGVLRSVTCDHGECPSTRDLLVDAKIHRQETTDGIRLRNDPVPAWLDTGAVAARWPRSRPRAR